MDQLIITLTKKHLNIGNNGTTGEDFYPQVKTLVEMIKLLHCLIKNQKKLSQEKELSQNIYLCNFVKSIEKATIEAKHWTFVLQEQRTRFIQFQRKAETDWKAAKFRKINVKENSKHVVATQITEFSSKMLATNDKNATRKKFIEAEMEQFKIRSESVNKIRRSRENDLNNARFRAKKRCLEQLAKYDDNIGELYTCKTMLLIDKDSIEEEYAVVQNQLIGQRNLHSQLREEHELNVMKASLAKLEYFRRNRAAKIIQQNWRLYCARVSSKKRKGRK